MCAWVSGNNSVLHVKMVQQTKEVGWGEFQAPGRERGKHTLPFPRSNPFSTSNDMTRVLGCE